MLIDLNTCEVSYESLRLSNCDEEVITKSYGDGDLCELDVDDNNSNKV